MSIKANVFGLAALPDSVLWLRRKETWAGDVRGNFLRMIGLVLFTVNEFINYYLLHSVDKPFHEMSLIVICVWLVASVDFHVLLRRHWLPRATPFLMPLVDISLLTWIIILAGGPHSPLVAIFFLIISLAGMRLNPLIVLFSTIGSIVAYVVTAVVASLQGNLTVPTASLVICALALALSGVILAHVIGRAFDLIERAAVSS